MHPRRSLYGTLLAATLLAACSTPARAAGFFNLSWSDCGTFGQLQRNFACDTNSGINTMVCSAVTGWAMKQLNGESSVLDMMTNQSTLSNWWWIGGVSPCRTAATLSADFNFLSNSNCVDPWLGAAAGGLSYTRGFLGPNRARIRTVCAISGSLFISATSEYYIFKTIFTNARTVGNGSCAGCTDGACFVMQSLLLTQPPGEGDHLIQNPLNRGYVQWQPGGGGVTGGCPQATPARATTWGQVKSLYR